MCGTIILMCLISVITRTSGEVIFNIEAYNNSMSCKQSQEKPAKATVLENEHLKLRLQFPGKNLGFNSFKCVANYGLGNVFVNNTSNSVTSVTSIQAKSHMSGIWNCTILTNKDINIIKPVVQVNILTDGVAKGSYTAIYCYVKVHVRLLETPQIILVNNMKLPTTRLEDTEQLVDHSAVYSYLDGDMVTVSCILGNNIIEADDVDRKHLIEFKYDYADNLGDMFKEPKDKPSELGYGFRTKLHASHDNSVMICKSVNGPDNYTTINVTFVLKEYFDGKGYIEVNGLIGRPHGGIKNGFSVTEFNISYFFLKNEPVSFVCKSNKNELRATDKQENCPIGSQSFSKQVETQSESEHSCDICDGSNNVFEKINVKIRLLHKAFNEIKRLNVDLPKSNILIEVYKYNGSQRYSWIYYEFDENDTVDLKCSMSKDIYGGLEVKYELNNEEIFEKTVTLTSEYDNRVFECRLQEKIEMNSPFNVIYKYIRVLFRKRHLTTTTSTTTAVSYAPKGTEGPQLNSTPKPFILGGDEVPIWAIAMGAVLMCIVLSCVAITIYKMRKRSQKRESGVDNYENLQNQNSQASIQPHPEQWSRNEEQVYNVPVDIRNDSNTYAEPVRGQEDPYATPIPKSQRPPKGAQDNLGPTYAELHFASGGKIMSTNSGDPQYSTVKELYTQVVPKNLRKNNQGNYGNVFPDSPYVNSENTEYVEPTYCQSFR